MVLSKKDTTVLRGLAILSIILHNFIHLPQFGFTEQNESSFVVQRTQDFLAGLGLGFSHVLGDLFSFLGWVGVPVFVFLSGYGLVMKYEKGGSLSVKKHVVTSWKKLFCLMAPAVLCMMLFHLNNGFYLVKNAVSLTLLSNLLIHIFPPDPAVYWYFGLTFELYLVYLFFYRFKRNGTLLAVSCIVLALQSVLVLSPGTEDVVFWNLKNFTGWLPVFSLGIYLGRRDDVDLALPVWVWLLLAVVCSALLVVCNLHALPWVFIHFPAVVLFLAMERLLEHTRYIRGFFLWFGGLSGFLFVVHPIVRGVVVRLLYGKVGLPVVLLAFLILSVAAAYGYRFVYKKLMAVLS